ncbi:related to N(G),N(G)-dimethylarginine dimethylaminohydrolase [Pseudozyma flocculosa]|uniref:Related to N(G),N(G)-dimethylarginine dimethylaminohydrolase n=1 Tax=Pseudozyma flocculosa TaxID=84751 RepID=A0A5C3FAN0_9BASI|nr:related to N(G),N(G)-dimethylarginine dimethylaminohydrolase [Pseudozyma flocculosa]
MSTATTNNTTSASPRGEGGGGGRGGGGTLLVRRPPPNLASGQITHISTPAPSSISHTLALAQWQAYISLFATATPPWQIIEVPPAPTCADSVFVEDILVSLPRGTILVTSPGAESRRPELDGIEEFLRAHLGGDVKRVVRIEGEARLDGGDLLKVGRTVYVGRSSRTNDLGRAQLRALLKELDMDLVEVPVTKALHLKSAVTALPDGTVIGYEPIVDDPSIFPSFLAVPEVSRVQSSPVQSRLLPSRQALTHSLPPPPRRRTGQEHGVAVVVLSPSHLVMSSDAPRTTQILRQRGYRVETVDISQFEALEGCVTCLSVRIRT